MTLKEIYTDKMVDDADANFIVLNDKGYLSRRTSYIYKTFVILGIDWDVTLDSILGFARKPLEEQWLYFFKLKIRCLFINIL